jgi:ubiquinone/menaquinone biosynthesis C-methylase UbiE
MEKCTLYKEKTMLKSSCLYLALSILLGVGCATTQPPGTHTHAQTHEQVESCEHEEHGDWINNPELLELNRKYDTAWAEWQGELFGLDIERGMIVADIGAGKGELTLLVAEKVGPKGLVYTNEIDAKKLDEIGDKVAHCGLQNIVPVLSRPDDPMIPPERVDMAIMVEVFHHLSDKLTFLENTRRRVKPGACLVIIEPDVNQEGGNPDGCYSDPGSTRRQVEQARFRVVELRTKKIEGLLFFVLTAAAHE